MADTVSDPKPHWHEQLQLMAEKYGLKSTDETED